MQEVLDHAHFCVELTEKFHGRNDLIQNVRLFIFNYNHMNNSIMIQFNF
jgi:hypothetical protein